jgi:hypothetical protein
MNISEDDMFILFPLCYSPSPTASFYSNSFLSLAFVDRLDSSVANADVVGDGEGTFFLLCLFVNILP